MILRRVIAHFRRQEWTAIAIDFVIVVLGVFVGLQVNTWNEARKDRATARSYLERIGADLDADIASLEDRLSFWSKVSDYGAAGLAYAETGATGDRTKWELLLSFFQASQLAEFEPVATTYEEMKSAGALGLIADLRLRGELGRYYISARNPSLRERPAYREHVRGMIPHAVQLYVWQTCYDTNIDVQRLLDCAPPIDDAAAAALVDRIAGDEALMAELRYWMSTMRVAGLISRNALAEARELRARIEAALGKRP